MSSEANRNSSRDWGIHLIIAMIAVFGIAAVLLMTYLPWIHFGVSNGSISTESTIGGGGSTYECRINGKQLQTIVLADRLRATSSWKPFSVPPPIPLERALTNARDAFPKLGIEFNDWKMASITLTGPWKDQGFYYAVRFQRQDDRVQDFLESFVIAVLLDGSVILPQQAEH